MENETSTGDASSEDKLLSDAKSIDENEQERTKEEDFTQVQRKRLCRNWAKNKCKLQDRCKFNHPELCLKFSKFGPQRRGNPKGCDNQCGLFHPRDKWCFRAIKTGGCKFGKECKFAHFKGVREFPIPGKTKGQEIPPRNLIEERQKVEERTLTTSQPKPSYARVAATDGRGFLGEACLGMIERIIKRLETLENRPQERAWPSFH